MRDSCPAGDCRGIGARAPASPLQNAGDGGIRGWRKGANRRLRNAGAAFDVVGIAKTGREAQVLSLLDTVAIENLFDLQIRPDRRVEVIPYPSFISSLVTLLFLCH